ncbi:MAG: cupin domain-containing protein [Desulfuromonadales bacterium]|nr:cupin domain-containing protein [Desulfuromonadales bacterium]
MSEDRLQQIISELDLQPHPEGGWFRETYRAAETIPASALPPRFGEQRDCATAIYFLLSSQSFSALHRIKSDEIWHFYSGAALTVHVIHPDGRYQPIRLGADLTKSERFQAVVPHGCWFGATVDTSADAGVDAPGAYSLVGCTVAPGFDFIDFEMADGASLSQQFPQHAAIISRLTR